VAINKISYYLQQPSCKLAKKDMTSGTMERGKPEATLWV